MNRLDILDFLFSQGIKANAIKLNDSDYSFPHEDWISGGFASAWRVVSKGETYRPNKNDCDDFARRCADYAAELHAADTSTGDTGLAFGEFSYVMKNGEAHAINVAIVADDLNAPKLLFFESQDGRVINLTQGEIESCTDLRM